MIQHQKKINNADYEINMLSEYNGSTDIFLLNLLQVLIYISGIFLIVNSGLSVGSIFAFATYSGYVTDPVISVLNILFLLSGIIPSAKRYFAFRGKEEENDILFRNLSFEINAGEKVAIIGGNGVEKSTLLKLIMRVYDPASGKIMLNDIPVEKYDLEKYRQMYAVVSQSVYLFNKSVKENILLYTEENQEICILDEANSNVDIYYEKQLEELLIEEMKDKTLIMITHRLDILSKTDKIIFLKHNSGYAIGTYQELIKKDEDFKDMVLNNQD